MNKGWLSLIGFLLFFYGMLSLVLSLIGAKLTFLTWLEAFGPLMGFVLKILMIVGGIVIVAVARSDFRGEEGI